MDRDKQIRGYIQEELKGHRLLRTVEINLHVENGRVTMHGMVDVLAEKWLAEEIVKKVPGVVGVDNSLTVVMDREVSDAQIFSSVEERFDKDPRIDLHQVEVGVNDGVVYLEGNVGTIAEANSALEVVAQVYGVKDVVNHIKVGGGAFTRDEATVTNEVELALSRSMMVNVKDVHTETFDGKVRLWGTVDTAEQIEAVDRIVSQVPGVQEVKNELTSRHGYRGEDINLTNELRAHLGNHGLGSVTGYVVDGIAFLAGEVDQPGQRMRAQELATEIPGIYHINNGINIDQS